MLAFCFYKFTHAFNFYMIYDYDIVFSKAFLFFMKFSAVLVFSISISQSGFHTLSTFEPLIPRSIYLSLFTDTFLQAVDRFKWSEVACFCCLGIGSLGDTFG